MVREGDRFVRGESDLVGDGADARFVPTLAGIQADGKRDACRGECFTPGHSQMIMHTKAYDARGPVERPRKGMLLLLKRFSILAVLAINPIPQSPADWKLVWH